jgi:ribosomal protein S18 acetylase RimI-like enzyme
MNNLSRLHSALTSTTEELQQILKLQEENLIQHIDETEMKSQGFVTLRHDLKILEQMHNLAPTVIIKDDDKVVAYALTMLKECRRLIPALEPMFSLLDELSWNGKPLTDHSFYVMGQVCIAKQYRGQGLFDELYNHHKKMYQSRFELFITEIATRNYRSVRAHERVGFKPIHTHHDNLDEWVVAGWDWK